MCLGMFMAVLDIQVVASSLTAIQGALHIPLSQLGWIQTAYLMAEVVAIPLTGILTRALIAARAVRARHFGFCRGQLGLRAFDRISRCWSRHGWCRDFSAAC